MELLSDCTIRLVTSVQLNRKCTGHTIYIYIYIHIYTYNDAIWIVHNKIMSNNVTRTSLLYNADITYDVVNFDSLAQANGFRIERRQVVFPCWIYDSKLGSLRHQIGSRLNVHSQIDCTLGDQTKFELDIPSLWWTSIQATWLHCRLAFSTWLWR